MGYTTRFSGAIKLSRPLKLLEAKFILDVVEEMAEPTVMDGCKPPGVGYLQWVPSESLDQVVWDEGEKFYEYAGWMSWLCGYLRTIGVEANGSLAWQGEDMADRGILRVHKNEVSKVTGTKVPVNAERPLSRGKLGEMALQAIGGGMA
jgi:hypothetical protein